jgi:AbrB family looped-hinge helix DNA binding protein
MIEQTEVKMDLQGHIVIPAELRRAIGVEAGSVLVARVEGQSIILEKPQTVLNRLKKRYSTLPSDVSLSQELIDERREESKHQN